MPIRMIPDITQFITCKATGNIVFLRTHFAFADSLVQPTVDSDFIVSITIAPIQENKTGLPLVGRFWISLRRCLVFAADPPLRKACASRLTKNRLTAGVEYMAYQARNLDACSQEQA